MTPPFPLLFALVIALLPATRSGSVVAAQARVAEQPPAGSTGDVPDLAMRPRRVLALYSEPSDHPVNVAFDAQFHAVLKRQSGNTVELYTEYFEPARFPGESQARIMRDYLRRKYAGRKIDVLFAWGPFTLPFLLKYRADLFPDTPIVYYVGTLDTVRNYPQPAMTGVLNPDTYGRTLELALSLHPDTTEVFIISGTADRDKAIERIASLQLQEFQGRVKLTYLTDLPLDLLIATVKSLPRRSIIIYSRQQSEQNTGKVLEQADYLDMVSRSAPVPVYGPWRSLLGYGSVGGVVDDLEAGATKAAEIALRVARGTPPLDIPPDRTPRIPTFDARQLRRWGISEDRLPPGSVILFREPTAWDQYKGYIIGSGIVLLVQTMLIAGLLAQRRQRRRTEALLKRSEQRYELATAAGLVGVWEWNVETDAVYMGPELARVMGFAVDEIDNRRVWLARAHPEDAARIDAEAQAYIDGRTQFYESEHRMLHKDGSLLWFLARGSFVRQPDGRPVTMFGTYTDITDRKRAETRLADAQEELARVSRLTALGEFAASIAHEVSQPLSAILMNSSACLRWLRSPAPPMAEIRTALQEIANAGSRAKELMRRNRELFQSHTVEKLLLDVNGVIREVAAIARTRLQHSQVTLAAALDEGLPAVLGDRVELQQVLLNLFVNGIDAMETIDPPSRQLRVESSVGDDGMVRIRVRDTGVGLDGVDVDRMFMPAYTTKPNGTGVGLSICRSIVEAHGGQLWAEHHHGPGTTFCFTIPVATTAAPEVQGGAAAHV